jgi:hypothetical protein
MSYKLKAMHALRNITFFAKVIHLHQVSSFCSLVMSKLKGSCFLSERVGFGYFPAVIPNEIT